MKLKELFGWWLSKVIYEGNPFKKIRAKKFYAQFVKEGDLCFDVGAHIGDRSKVWIELGAKVVGIEPQPKFSAYLSQKFKDSKKYVNEQIGLGAINGTAILNISSMFPTLSTLAGKEWMDDINNATPLTISYDRQVEVKVFTLDHMIEKHGKPRFIKIDVEGYEKEVLTGLSQKIECISFEFLSFGQDHLSACLEILHQLGYTSYNWSYKETFKMAIETWATKEDLEIHIAHYKKGNFSGDVYAK